MQPGGLAIESDAQVRRALDGLWIGDIAVRYGEAAAHDRLLTVGGFVGVEQEIERCAAGDVSGHLPSELIGRFRHFDQVLSRNGKYAAVCGIVITVKLRVLSVRLAKESGAEKD